MCLEKRGGGEYSIQHPTSEVKRQISESGLTKLPPELHILITSFLHGKEGASLPFISKQFYNMHNDLLKELLSPDVRRMIDVVDREKVNPEDKDEFLRLLLCIGGIDDTYERGYIESRLGIKKGGVGLSYNFEKMLELIKKYGKYFTKFDLGQAIQEENHDCQKISGLETGPFTRLCDIDRLIVEIATNCPELSSFSTKNKGSKYANTGEYNGYSEESVTKLFANCPKLLLVTLTGRCITDELLSHLAKNCRELSTVNLEYCNIFKDVITKFVKNCPKLTSLNFDFSCRVPKKEDIMDLRSQYPNISFTHARFPELL